LPASLDLDYGKAVFELGLKGERMRCASGFGTVLVVLAIVNGGCGAGNAAIKPGPMPSEGSFSGVYFSPQYGEMHVVQNGNAVVGKYTKDERSGRIQGEADGDVMRFEWTETKAMVSNRPQETRGHGYFRYMVDASNGDHVLKGRWGLGDNDSTGGEWNAYKSRTRKPELDQPPSASGSGSAGDEDTSSDSTAEESEEP
jgi:hypothetical protein